MADREDTSNTNGTEAPDTGKNGPTDAASSAGDTQAAARQEAEAPQFKIQRIYLKDVSYESPQAPGIFVGSTSWKPSVSMHLNTESTRLENDQFESVLTVTVTVSLDDKTAYLAEVKQAGLFLIRNVSEAQMGPMLGSFCPNLLFPFAREAVASLVQKGGFPQLLLDPVNFDLLYAQHQAKARQNVSAPDTTQ